MPPSAQADFPPSHPATLATSDDSPIPKASWGGASRCRTGGPGELMPTLAIHLPFTCHCSPNRSTRFDYCTPITTHRVLHTEHCTPSTTHRALHMRKCTPSTAHRAEHEELCHRNAALLLLTALAVPTAPSQLPYVLPSQLHRR